MDSHCKEFKLKCVKATEAMHVYMCVFSLLSNQCVNALHPSILCVWIQSWALCVRRQVELCSTDLHIFHSIEWPSQIIKCPFISKGHWQGLGSKANTEGPVRGHCPSHCGLQHCGWQQPSRIAPEVTVVIRKKCSKVAVIFTWRCTIQAK